MIFHAEMSTYIWVIFIILGLIGNAVSAARKKNQARQRPRVNPETSPEDVLEEEPLPPVYEQVPEVPSTYSFMEEQFSTPPKSKKQKKSKKKHFQEEGGRVTTSTFIADTEETDDSSDESFDLRKAVIYSEILNRKY